MPFTQSGWQLATKTVAFDGSAGNGAQGTVALFTVTGAVAVQLYPVRCTENMAGVNATLDYGVTGVGGRFTNTTPVTATGLTAGTWWDIGVGAKTGAAPVEDPLSQIATWAVSANLIGTVATADITNGTLVYCVRWLALSSDGALVAS